jgi:hypothetical protein
VRELAGAWSISVISSVVVVLLCLECFRMILYDSKCYIVYGGPGGIVLE